MIAIVDYGVGNLFSLCCSLGYIGHEAVITGDASVIASSDKIILPGVGAFADAAEKLRASGLGEVVKCEVGRGKPLLGVCLGMQLLFDKSFEFGEHEGLGLLRGEVVSIITTGNSEVNCADASTNDSAGSSTNKHLFRDDRGNATPRIPTRSSEHPALTSGATASLPPLTESLHSITPADALCSENCNSSTLKVPHIGWNSLTFKRSHKSEISPLFKYINEGDYVYFVHSFHAAQCEESLIASTEYGSMLTAAVAKDNVFGTQFHPEKSGEVGLNILRAFAEG